MGMSNWILDMEEKFFDHVTETDLAEAETFEQFVKTAVKKMNSKLPTHHVEGIASQVWNDYWSNY